jgi:ABC-type transport system involved in cytochrome bd biosynthesis fused ATPase/permease subunit
VPSWPGLRPFRDLSGAGGFPSIIACLLGRYFSAPSPEKRVLDEATASVDNETEAAIQRSIQNVALGRSVILIAHRLSTVRNAKQIYVIDDGRVLEKGTHEELLETNGLYASLWRVQTGSQSDSPEP